MGPLLQIAKDGRAGRTPAGHVSEKNGQRELSTDPVYVN